ncbi:PocR ligand-binding domain-containing protein [Clostridium grantii]|uniref:AraC-type DNA-binding protein n=1 Tax=Clostridium grantii DSM 8605 TaxID=1121316 RepID=A0A1M5X0I8_9CLOT|nr:PocR ligand-binding domain-containing protein [Clostridium grantii]SHH92954.1 AraC-type DNA-binding protein [Clostridium grantii DSM 8605]
MKVLFKDEEVQKLLNDYQSLINVRIAVFDTHFNELFSSPKTISDFCSKIRCYPKVADACKYCDHKAFRQSKANKDIYIYKCHLGLYEAVTPIHDNEEILGYIMIGQVLDENPKKDQWQQLCRKLSSLTEYSEESNHFEDLKPLYNNLKQMSIDQIESVSRIMKACASSIWLQHIIDIERSPIIQRINNYVLNNYKETITTEKICHDLKISKTTIYNYLKTDYNLSLSQYINNIRLEKAKELLKESSISIADISCSVGFDDYNYFSRIFKTKYKITPSKYRKTFNMSLNNFDS